MKYCAKYALDNCSDDLHYFECEYPLGERGLQERLRNVVENDFAQITYTEAVIFYFLLIRAYLHDR